MVDSPLKTLEDYVFSRPVVSSDQITGRLMSVDGTDSVVRAEDVAFMYEADYERFVLFSAFCSNKADVVAESEAVDILNHFSLNPPELQHVIRQFTFPTFWLFYNGPIMDRAAAEFLSTGGGAQAVVYGGDNENGSIGWGESSFSARLAATKSALALSGDLWEKWQEEAGFAKPLKREVVSNVLSRCKPFWLYVPNIFDNRRWPVTQNSIQRTTLTHEVDSSRDSDNTVPNSWDDTTSWILDVFSYQTLFSLQKEAVWNNGEVVATGAFVRRLVTQTLSEAEAWSLTAGRRSWLGDKVKSCHATFNFCVSEEWRPGTATSTTVTRKFVAVPVEVVYKAEDPLCTLTLPDSESLGDLAQRALELSGIVLKTPDEVEATLPNVDTLPMPDPPVVGGETSTYSSSVWASQTITVRLSSISLYAEICPAAVHPDVA